MLKLLKKFLVSFKMFRSDLMEKKEIIININYHYVNEGFHSI